MSTPHPILPYPTQPYPTLPHSLSPSISGPGASDPSGRSQSVGSWIVDSRSWTLSTLLYSLCYHERVAQSVRTFFCVRAFQEVFDQLMFQLFHIIFTVCVQILVYLVFT
jgi:hypothetical protein